MSCPPGSYCKYWQNPPVCQGTNTPCSVASKFSCSGPNCVQDPNGTFGTCAEANCNNPNPNFCCETGVGTCKPFNGNCPAGWTVVSSCNPGMCPVPAKTVFCCDDSVTPKKCSSAENYCPDNLRPVDQCSDCTSPPTPTYVSCCDPLTGNCNGNYLNSCPQGMTQVLACNSTTCPKPVSCCDASTGNCSSNYYNNCPQGMTQVSSCNTTTCPTPVSCCDPSTGNCKGNYPNSCPQGFNQVSACNSTTCPTPVSCCDPSSGNCNSNYPNSCPQGMTQVSACNSSTCPKLVSCCDPNSGNCNGNYPNSCPQGMTQVSACNSTTCPTPVNCCDSSSGNCLPYKNNCPTGMKQVQVCNDTTCPKIPPSTTCANAGCAQGGFSMTFWAEHPPIGVDVTEPKVIQYYQLMNKFICSPNPAGMCVSTLVLRLEEPVESDGSHNCFYPSVNSPLYSQLLVNLPSNFQLYALPYFDATTSWAAYPDTQEDIAALGSLATIPCTAACNVIPCSGDCPSGYQCVNGSCFTPSDQCGTCPPGQNCYLKYLAKYPECLSECKGMCCEGTVDPSGAGNCCNATCDNALAKSVLLTKRWNDLLGRQLFKGVVVDSEGSGYSRAVIARKVREASVALGANLLVGTTYDGSNVGRCVADLTATDDTRIDLAFPEVYNLTTQCNNGNDPWAANSQLVDSYDKAPTIGGCNALPYPSTSSLYAQAWQSATPAQTLWSGNGALNFQSIIQYGWKKQVPQEVANRIYPLLSVETSAISPVQTCMYPAGGSGGPCGIPNAFGVWNTVQGAQQFIQFVKLFQGSLGSIFLPGSGNIPMSNFGVFSFPIMPKAWFGY